jgi:hypothetical protein
MRAKYVVPAVRAVTRLATTAPLVGVLVGDATVKNEEPGQVGEEVAR